MKISVNDKELFSLSEIQKKVICDNISEDIFESDMRRRLRWVLMHKYEQCFKALKAEWDQKLAALGVASVPTDPDEYAKVVFSQPTYQCRKTRDEVAAKELAASV